MSTPVLINCVFVGGIILIFHVNGLYFNQIQTYTGTCNETITLSDIGGAGKLFYTHYKHQNTQRCTIMIEAGPGYHVGYGFMKQSAYRAIHSSDDHLCYICTSVTFYQGYKERNYNCLNVRGNFTKQIETTEGNKLTLEILGDKSKTFSFELVFFSFHNGRCNSNETSCRLTRKDRLSVCVSQDTVIENEFIFCGWNSEDYDDFWVYKNPSGGLVAAVVLLGIILVPMLLFCGCVIYRKYCKQLEPEPEDVPTRARRIFAAIVEEAHENAGYDTGPIDPNKFDPPPDYSSLEQMDGLSEMTAPRFGTSFNEISVDRLPSYNDVMKNSNEYLVSCHI